MSKPHRRTINLTSATYTLPITPLQSVHATVPWTAQINADFPFNIFCWRKALLSIHCSLHIVRPFSDGWHNVRGGREGSATVCADIQSALKWVCWPDTSVNQKEKRNKVALYGPIVNLCWFKRGDVRKRKHVAIECYDFKCEEWTRSEHSCGTNSRRQQCGTAAHPRPHIRSDN